MTYSLERVEKGVLGSRTSFRQMASYLAVGKG